MKVQIELKHIEMWTEDGYQCSVHYRPSTFGDWCWGVTDLSSGEGLGGFSDSLENARTAADEQVKLNKESVK